MPHPLDTILARYSDRPREESSGYVFLANVGGLEGGPKVVAPCLEIRRATLEERAEIILLLQYNLGPSEIHHLPWDHRTEFEPSEDGRGGILHWDPLPVEEHRYHVLEFHGSNVASHALLQANVMSAGPTLLRGSELHWGAVRGASSTPSLGPILDDLRFNPETLVTLRESDLIDLGRVYPKYFSHDENVIGVRGAVGDFRALDQPQMPPGLKLLGYFGILESLLVHKPRPEDPYSSITRQLKKKLALLARRLARPTDLSVAPLKLEKTWDALYELRSVVAHGGRPSFDKGPLVALRSTEASLGFVREVSRSVIRQALEEPELVADLREC